MRAADASARWGCTHAAPDGCPWCQNPDAEIYRDASDYVPIYGIPAQPVAPVSTLAEFIESVSPGFWERGSVS